MRKFENKKCLMCNSEFEVTGSNTKYCKDCRKIRAKEAVKAAMFKSGVLNGKGSGSTTGRGKDNHMFKHGKLTFKRWARERKALIGLCEHCGKDIKNATWHEWVGHHKDHNKENNVIDNLVLLCKRCHQIEHECWKAFEGVETKVTRDLVTGRYKRIEAPTNYL